MTGRLYRIFWAWIIPTDPPNLACRPVASSTLRVASHRPGTHIDPAGWHPRWRRTWGIRPDQVPPVLPRIPLGRTRRPRHGADPYPMDRTPAEGRGRSGGTAAAGAEAAPLRGRRAPRPLPPAASRRGRSEQLDADQPGAGGGARPATRCRRRAIGFEHRSELLDRTHRRGGPVERARGQGAHGGRPDHRLRALRPRWQGPAP